jgi:hypothetical protein
LGRAYPEPISAKSPWPKSHNHCAEVLVARFTGEVEDNLSIHSKASLYEAFPAVEARRFE